MKRIKEILICALALMVISGAVTAALAGTNALTKGEIQRQNDEIATAARLEVMKADTFEQASVTLDGADMVYYKALTDGKVTGYVFTTEAAGKSAGLTVMTGISNEGKITGVKVTEQNETAGYVDKVIKAGFLTAFEGKDAVEIKLGGQVDAVSQATKTSSGICKAVNKAIAAYKAVKEGAQIG